MHIAGASNEEFVGAGLSVSADTGDLFVTQTKPEYQAETVQAAAFAEELAETDEPRNAQRGREAQLGFQDASRRFFHALLEAQAPARKVPCVLVGRIRPFGHQDSVVVFDGEVQAKPR